MSKVEKIQRDLLQKEAQFYSVHVSQTQTETPGTPNLQTLARGNPSWWHLVAFPSIKSCSDQAGASMAGGFLEEAEHSSADVLGVCKVRKAAGVAPWVLPSNSSRAQDSSSTFHEGLTMPCLTPSTWIYKWSSSAFGQRHPSGSFHSAGLSNTMVA